jgi:hypothetical protein
MSKAILEDVNVGDWVFTIRNGWTRITELVEGSFYTIECVDRYSVEGKRLRGDAFPSAWPKGHPDIPHWAPPCPEDEKPKFEPFDKVLVRDEDRDYWKASLFSHYTSDKNYPYNSISAAWAQCITFEGNEHLVGTRGNVE